MLFCLVLCTFFVLASGQYIQLQTTPQLYSELPIELRNALRVPVSPFLGLMHQPAQYHQIIEQSRPTVTSVPIPGNLTNVGTHKFRVVRRYFIPIGPARVFYSRIPQLAFWNSLREQSALGPELKSIESPRTAKAEQLITNSDVHEVITEDIQANFVKHSSVV